MQVTPTGLGIEGEDLSCLRSWLDSTVPEFGGLLGATLLKGGQSNPTFRLDTDGGPLVLRKRPDGAEAWAHDIRREFRVLTALAGTDVPVPQTYAYCDDPRVIGGEFYLMSFVDGRIIDDCRLPGLSPGERRAVYLDLCRVFARLHAVDARAVGLADFGRPEAFVERQLRLHARNFLLYRPAGEPDMAWLAAHLPAVLPPTGRSAIVHNDIRVGNVVLHPVEPRVIAILDWEMATLGDAFVDAGLLTLPYFFPEQNPQGSLRGFDAQAAGIPLIDEMNAAYCQALGVAGFPDYEARAAFNLFRYASVYAGIADRARKGQAVSDDANAYDAVVAPTAAAGRAVLSSVLSGPESPTSAASPGAPPFPGSG